MNNKSQGKNKQNMWQDAIADMQARIKRTEKRLADLKAAERTFRLNMEQGRSWPGEDAGTDKPIPA